MPVLGIKINDKQIIFTETLFKEGEILNGKLQWCC